ncbi:hypothetical protein ERJ75_000339700 [Trypanosoma vivax]|nr:hypothetical protein ERJ75_000339700 [Trypanosoma vivax]
MPQFRKGTTLRVAACVARRPGLAASSRSHIVAFRRAEPLTLKSPGIPGPVDVHERAACRWYAQPRCYGGRRVGERCAPGCHGSATSAALRTRQRVGMPSAKGRKLTARRTAGQQRPASHRHEAGCGTLGALRAVTPRRQRSLPGRARGGLFSGTGKFVRSDTGIEGAGPGADACRKNTNSGQAPTLTHASAGTRTGGQTRATTSPEHARNSTRFFPTRPWL